MLKVELQVGSSSVRVEGDFADVERILDAYWKPAGASAAPSFGAGTPAGHTNGVLKELNEDGRGSQIESAGARVTSKARKSKAIPKLLKDLILDVGGKSAQSFAAVKSPATAMEKSTVAVFYMLREIELPTIGVDHVYTFFKYVGWPLPTDPLNTLQKAGSEGWLDTKNSADIKIAPSGENLVEHSLPRAKPKKD